MAPVILPGAIYWGVLLATEAAAVAGGYALIIEIFVHRDLNP